MGVPDIYQIKDFSTRASLRSLKKKSATNLNNNEGHRNEQQFLASQTELTTTSI